MALTLRLDEETQSDLSSLMKTYHFTTASKAIVFIIQNFENLDQENQLSIKSYQSLEDEFHRFTDLVKQRKLLDEEINGYDL